MGGGERLGQLAVALVAAVVVLAGVTPFAVVGTASAATLTVNDSGGADYTTIQAAVDDASAGDTIQVAAGTYTESVTIDKPLTLVGDPGDGSLGPGGSVPVVNPPSGTPDYGFTLTEDADGTTIEGFQFGAFEEGSIYFDVASGTLADVTIRDNRIDGTDDGIDGQDIDGGLSNVVVTNNHFVSDYGIYWDVYGDVADVSITNNKFDDGSGDVSDDENVYIYFNDVSVSNLDISGNEMDTYYEGVYLDGDVDGVSDVTVTNNDIYSDDEGVYVYLYGNSGAVIDGVSLLDNTIESVDDEGIELDLEANEGRLSDVTIRRNVVDSPDYYGIDVELDGDNSPIERIAIENNEVSSYDEAVYFEVDTDAGDLSDVSISNNDLDSSSWEAMYLSVDLYEDAAVDGFAVNGNRITGADEEGIYLVVYGGSSSDSTVAGLTVSDNDISGVAEEGIYLEFYRVDTGDTVQVTDNAVTGAGGDGLAVDADELATDDVVSMLVEGNTIESSGDDAVDITATAGGTLQYTLRDNAFTDSADHGVELGSAVDPSGITISQNNIAGNDGGGIDNENTGAVVDARNNYWGASDGPSSAVEGLLADPVDTDTLADGAGDSVSGPLLSESELSLSNVRFAPFATDPFTIGADAPSSGVVSGGGPRIEIGDATFSPSDPVVGEQVTIRIPVENTGSGTGSLTGLLRSDFTTQGSVDIELDSGESTVVSRTVRYGDAKSYNVYLDDEYVGGVTVGTRDPMRVNVTADPGNDTVDAAVENPRRTAIGIPVPPVNASDTTGITLTDLSVTPSDIDDFDLGVVQSGASVDATNVTNATNGSTAAAATVLPNGAGPVSSFTFDSTLGGDGIDAGTMTFSVNLTRYPSLADATNASASLAVYRYDDATGTYTQVPVTVASETNESLTVSVPFDGSSTYVVGIDRSAFDVSTSIRGNPVTAGDSLSLVLEVTNVGDGPGVYSPAVALNGRPVTSGQLTLDAGETGTLVVELSTTTAGTWPVTVDGRLVAIAFVE